METEQMLEQPRGRQDVPPPSPPPAGPPARRTTRRPPREVARKPPRPGDGGGDAEIVLRHDHETAPCSRCGELTGPGVIGVRREERFCEVCVLTLERRLGMLLFLAHNCRTFAFRSTQNLPGFDETSRTVMLELVARLFDITEQRYPAKPPANWLRPDEGAALAFAGVSAGDMLIAGEPDAEAVAVAWGRVLRLRRDFEEIRTCRSPGTVDDLIRLSAEKAEAETVVDRALAAERSKGPTRTTTELLASRAKPAEPDALSLALLVEVVDVGGILTRWQQRDTAQALAWLLRASPRASAHVDRLLASAGSEVEPGALLTAAKGELVG